MTTVRPASTEDLERIIAFQHAMAIETESRALDADRVASGVRALFDNAAAGFYLVAEADGDVVGSLMVTPEWSDWRNGWFWWIQSVFVEASHRRRGVYRALHEAVRERARGRGDVRGIRLYVERNNAAARTTYGALGMSESLYRLYEQGL